MNKISLIIQREYLSRVKNKRFILTTILTPLLFVLFIAGSTYLSIQGRSEQKIAVVDANGFFKNNLKSSADIIFDFTTGVDTSNYLDKGYTAILLIPKFGDTAKKAEYIIRSKKKIGLIAEESIKEKINKAIEDKMLLDAGIDKSRLDSIHQRSQYADLKPLEEKGNKVEESNARLAYGIGFGSGLLIYITMFIYGAMVMRGVIWKKKQIVLPK